MKPLSARQREVLRLLADGLPDKAIADCLGICRGTIRKHLEQARQRFGATNRIALAVAFVRLDMGHLAHGPKSPLPGRRNSK